MKNHANAGELTPRRYILLPGDISFNNLKNLGVATAIHAVRLVFQSITWLERYAIRLYSILCPMRFHERKNTLDRHLIAKRFACRH